MKYRLKTIIAIFAGVLYLIVFSSAHAATLFLTPVNSEIGVGEKLTIELRVDSEGVSFNAAQAVISFPKGTLQVVSLDKSDSAFSFWLEDPKFSNTDGTISFTGGTPYGVSGGSIQILRIVFAPKGSGAGKILVNEAAITASDGSGTNILSKMIDAVVTIVPSRVTSTPKIPPPTTIIREPVPASGLPVKPNIKVALYPNETEWYNLSGQFTANWNLPSDIFGISTAINKQPNFTPTESSEGLFESKTFDALGDGIQYLHARFQNNMGWGPITHYKIAVDTKPPLGFEANVLEGEKTDNPIPTLQFKTSDALSGLKEYQIRIGDSGNLIQIPVKNFTGSFKLPLQAPGKKKIFIKAVDFAGNSIEDSIDLEILPIASPTITFVPTEVFPEDEQGLVVKGTALPKVNVLIKVQKVSSGVKGEIVAENVARPDDRGNWEITLGNQPLRNGQYVVLAQNQDDRGALSLVVESKEIQVKSKPIIQIGIFQLGMGGAVLFLLFILIAGFASGVWFYKKRQAKLAMRVEFTESEVTKIFRLIAEDVKRLSDSLETLTKSDDEYSIKRLRENIAKMESYLKKGVEKIKK